MTRISRNARGKFWWNIRGLGPTYPMYPSPGQHHLPRTHMNPASSTWPPPELISKVSTGSPLFPGGSLTVSLVAFKRFTDMVPMTIDQELLRGLDWDRGLNSALTKCLGITGPGSLEKAKEYLQEPPDVRSRREDLMRKYERLLSAKRELLII